jgi:hypothetical protein
MIKLAVFSSLVVSYTAALFQPGIKSALAASFIE